MSRLSGRLSMPGRDGEAQTNDTRNRRMFAGILGHLNSGSTSNNRGTNKNWRSNQNEQEDDGPKFQQSEGRKSYNSNRSERGGRNNRGGGGFTRNNDRRSYPSQSTSTNNEQARIHQTRRVENEEPAEELLDLDDIITQISDLNVRCDRSAVQIKRNITKSTLLLDAMDEDEWEKLCETLTSTAIQQGEHDFVVDLFVSLLDYDLFNETMSSELMSISSNFIMNKGESTVPTYLASILCAHWPRHYAKAIDSVNLILYTTACIIKGWIQVLENDNNKFYKHEPKSVPPPIVEQDEADEIVKKEEEKEEPKEDEEEDPEIVNRCALALCELCEANQRQLWMKWPTYCDEIYMCIKPAITHNKNLSGETKHRLLNTYLQINSWTKSRAVTTKNSSVQTATEKK